MSYFFLKVHFKDVKVSWHFFYFLLQDTFISRIRCQKHYVSDPAGTCVHSQTRYVCWRLEVLNEKLVQVIFNPTRVDLIHCVSVRVFPQGHETREPSVYGSRAGENSWLWARPRDPISTTVHRLRLNQMVSFFICCWVNVNWGFAEMKGCWSVCFGPGTELQRCCSGPRPTARP